MGHFIFIVLHVIAVLFGMVLLVVTIPMHLIYAAVKSKAKPQGSTTSPLTHVRCPDCKELVHAEAVKCKHCGAVLIPADLSAAAAEADRQRRVDSNSDATAKWVIAAILVAAGARLVRESHVSRYALLALAILATQAGADPLRSRALRSDFQRLNPCPATGERRGACPGYEVDHREALICGGKDELQNLQWLPVAEHREKTKVEVKLCRARAARQQQEPPKGAKKNVLFANTEAGAGSAPGSMRRQVQAHSPPDS